MSPPGPTSVLPWSWCRPTCSPGTAARRAVAAVWEVVAEGNRYVERVRPWELARAGDAAGLDAALGTLLASCRVLGELLAPFLPDAAARIAAQLAVGPDGRLPAPLPLFARL